MLALICPSSSATSLFVVANNSQRCISVWSATTAGHLHITDVKVEGHPRGIGVDLNGYVYVSCWYSVHIFDPRNNYQLLQTLGGQKHGSARGEFNEARGMAVDDTNIVMIVDCCNHRVQFFD